MLGVAALSTINDIALARYVHLHLSKGASMQTDGVTKSTQMLVSLNQRGCRRAIRNQSHGFGVPGYLPVGRSKLEVGTREPDEKVPGVRRSGS